MTTELPPLPEPDMGHQKAPDDCEWETSYSAEAVRAYAAEPVRLARQQALEEAARVCETYAVAESLKEGSRASGKKAGAFDCADAIRQLKDRT